MERFNMISAAAICMVHSIIKVHRNSYNLTQPFLQKSVKLLLRKKQCKP